MSKQTQSTQAAVQAEQRSSVDSLQLLVENGGLALGLIALAALTSIVSQLTLSPVYGSIPSGINHQTATSLTFLLGFLIHHYLGQGPRSAVLTWLPLLAALVPAAEYLVLSFSGHVGIVGGPILAGLVSCHSMIVPTGYAVASIAAGLPLALRLPSIHPVYVHAGLALLPFLVFERFFAGQLPEIIASSRMSSFHVLSPADIQLVIPAALVLLCGSGPAIVVSTWSLLIASYLGNSHGTGPYAAAILERSLNQHDWTLLARKWSTTGYISVLESRKDDYRVLRCDHSLLGGEWRMNDDRRSQGWTDNETVYSVFTMLEAVRLLQIDKQIEDTAAQALVIGLGVGTAPKAFIRHGIDTTIVELDPTVYNYATEFFSLPINHTAIITDAIAWTQQQAQKDDFERPRYDYILHDVFTGGAEPLQLFTDAFLANLRALLSEDGVAAINYAGDLTMPLTTQVLNTIDLAFDRQCEVYSDDAARKDGSVEPFSNFILFCRNSPGAITFRAPTTADYLGSFSRQNYLYPRPEQRIQKTWLGSNDVLQAKDIRSWRKAQEASAKKHWTIMRTVLPARIWELY